MATKPKAILSTHDGREASPITRASNVLFENGQTAQDILNDRQDAMISPVIENSSSMFKVGQGDNVDYSSNVVNGAYESMVLKGKTMVNCIQEPSSKDVVLPYEFEEGHYVTINDTKESGALGVELKGQTLKSLYTKTFTLDPKTQYSQLSVAHDKIQIELNKEYTIMIDVYKNNSNCPLSFNTYGHNITPTNGLRFNAGETGRKIAKVVFTSKQYARWFWFETSIADTTATDSIQCEITVVDGNYVDVVHSHFEGLISCKMPILHTVGKNLFDLSRMKETGSGTGHTINLSNNSLTTSDNNTHVTGKGYIITGLKKNTPYRLTVTNDSSSEGTANFNVCSRDGSVWYEQRLYDIPIGSTQSRIIYTDTGSLRVSANAHIPVGCTVTLKDIQIEEVASENVQPTTYEPHKSSILSLPEEVVLRSLPNGVCDTFNTRTGVYTQRIGDDTFTGTSNENWIIPNNYTTGDTLPFRIKKPTMQGNGSVIPTDIICDKMKIETPRNAWGNDGYDKEGLSHGTGKGDGVDVRILKSKLTTHDVAGFKAWLSQNPIRVQYQLHTPIVTKINLSSTLKSWNTTTHIYSEIPENTLYPILSHSNPTYPVILKPSTKYSIVANSYGNNHTNSTINFNLGGATATTTVGNRVTTITTPSTLSNELLTMSGRGNKLNNVMVIEGDIVGDEPYFEGICDCKSPILSNVGKNLFDKELLKNRELWKDGGHAYYCIPIQLKPNTRYTWKRNSNILTNKDNIYFSIAHSQNPNGSPATWVLHPANTSMGTIQATFTSSNTGVCYYCLYPINTNGVFTRFCQILDEMKMQLEEGTTATPYEPYKSNILSANGDKIELTEDMFEQGAIAQYVNSQNIGKTYQWMKDNSDPNYDKRRLRLKNLVKVKPNTKLILQNTDNFMYAMCGFDSNKLTLSTFETGWIQNAKVTIPQDVHYISFFIRKKDDTAITINDFKNTNFTLSEIDKTIVLRSLPNGVCDTLNVITGEHVQRIGEVVLDGSKTMSVAYADVSDRTTLLAHMAIANMKIVAENNINDLNVDKMTSEPHSIWSKSVEGVHNKNQNIYVNILKSRLVSNDWSGVQQWLSQNPITVQYELATPIVTTIDIQGFPYAYANGHIQLTSGSIEPSLTPKVEYSVATNRNGQIRSNQKMVERHQKQLDQLQAIILANLVNSQYNQTLTTLKYELSRV